jgi:subtilisin family serine protease
MSRSVIFIDSRVASYKSILEGLKEPADVFFLDSNSEGLLQIAEHLRGMSGIEAIHIISHGSLGALYLGSTALNSSSLPLYESQLASIGRSLTETGDILLYGCNVAQGDEGFQFIQSWAKYSGADVAASTNVTGGSDLGGDSYLESQTGTISTTSLIPPKYQFALLIETESNNDRLSANPVNLGTPIDGALSGSTDVDYYAVTVSAAGVLSLIFNRPDTAYSDFSVKLEDANGVSLGAFTDSTDPQTFTIGVAQAGTYYARISGASSYSFDTGQYSVTFNHTAGSVAGYESEANDTRATADAVTLGSAITGQIASGTDVDYYAVTVSAAGVLSLILDVPTNSSYTDYFRVSVTDTNGNVIAAQETGQDITFQAAVGAAGTYYLSVGSPKYFYDGGQYTLKPSYSSNYGGYELEPNNSIANVITSGESVRGQVATVTDTDRFSLNIAQAGTLAVVFDAPTNSSYTEYFRIQLFDSAGNLLASRATGQDINFNASAPSPGNYYVTVTAAGSYYDSGQYALTVTNTASTVLYESEVNNTNDAADTIALGTQISGQLSSANDEDRFAVTLNSPGKITAVFDGPTNSSWSDYFELSIYDKSGHLVGHHSSGSDVAFDTNVTASGTYYVSIAAGKYYYDGGEYKLTIEAQLDQPIPTGAIVGTTNGDRLFGTTGDDIFFGLGGNDLIDGGQGIDTVVFRSAASSLSLSSVEGLTAIRGAYSSGEHAYSTTRLWNVEKIQTYDGTQSLPNVPVSPIIGTPQNDRLLGTSGNDILDGLGGSDFIDGGNGDDTLVLFGAKDKFTILTSGGITRIQATADAYEYASQTTKIVNVEMLAFSQNQSKTLVVSNSKVVFGTAGADKLVGSSSNEAFDGQGGNDVIDGGAGSDTIVFFDSADKFTVTFPTESMPTTTVIGKPGGEYAGYSVLASNVETLTFIDRTVLVNNPPKVVLTPSTTILAEGGIGAILEVSLSVAPESNVIATVAGGSQLTTSTTTLNFDPSNWKVPQSITVTAVDDTALEGVHSAELVVSLQTADYLYKGLRTSNVSYTISDNGNDLATTGGVSGKIWNDFDKDGTYDISEGRLAGWTVFDDVNRNGKLDSGESSAVTDSSGNYLLGNLAPGSHTITATTPPGWLPTAPGQGNTSATIIAETAPPGIVTGGDLSETVVSQATALATYANLGLSTKIAAFHSDSRFSSINGQGAAVVVIDSGIDLNHPYFGADNNSDGIADRIVFQFDFVGKNDSDASDGNGHGTHVAGIIGSSNVAFPGIAPEVNLIVLRVLDDQGNGRGSDILEALNWVISNVAKYNIVAVNISLGDESFSKFPYSGYAATQFKTLANDGVVVVSAAGNDYAGEQGVSYPSSDPYSLSVGAVWASPGKRGTFQTGVTDALAFFSQRDDTESDIFAPGVAIGSAKLDGTYVLLDGTSMAAPEISGMVALAQQLAKQELGRHLSFDEIRGLFKSTGSPIIDGDDENDSVPNTGLTFYRADMLALAEAIIGLKPPSSHSVTVSAGNTAVDRDFGFAATAAVQALSGDDLIFGTAYGEELRGGAGADQINGGAGDDQLYGEEGNDSLTGGVGADWVFGNSGDDTLIISADGIWGSGFRVANLGSPGSAGTGALTILSGKNRLADVLDGGTGADTLKLTESSDAFCIHDAFSQFNTNVNLASDGQGVLSTTRFTAIETILAGAGDDVIDLTSADYSIGGVLVDGGTGNDILWGNAGADKLIGGSGDDTLFGGEGDDTLVGGTGADIFEFAKSGSASDVIEDFTPGTDKIRLYGAATASEVIVAMNDGHVRLSWGGQTIELVGVTSTSGSEGWFEIVNVG